MLRHHRRGPQWPQALQTRRPCRPQTTLKMKRSRSTASQHDGHLARTLASLSVCDQAIVLLSVFVAHLFVYMVASGTPIIVPHMHVSIGSRRCSRAGRSMDISTTNRHSMLADQSVEIDHNWCQFRVRLSTPNRRCSLLHKCCQSCGATSHSELWSLPAAAIA